MLVVLLACTGAAPEDSDTGWVPPTPLVPAEPRTMDFAAIPAIGPGTVVDTEIDVGGRSAVLVTQASTAALWVDEGGGWTHAADFGVPLPTCVALNPTDTRIFVGGHEGWFWAIDSGVSASFFVDGWTLPFRRCAWLDDGRIVVTSSSEDGRDGGVLVGTPFSGGVSWDVVRPDIVSTSAQLAWDQGFGADGLLTGAGAFVTVGVAYGPPGVAPDPWVVAGPVDADTWSHDDAASSIAPHLGRPRDIARHGGVRLYRSDTQDAWFVWALGGPGTYGYAELTAAGATGPFRAVDVGLDGHVWLGGQGLYRSVEPL